jgi:hypothetical protein
LKLDEIGLCPEIRRGLCGIEVEMPERESELQRQRKQRQPRARLDVSPEPLHGITDVTL